MLDLIPENITAISARMRSCGWSTLAIRILEPAGQGNMNRTLRAHLDDGSTLILKQSLDYVAKYPDIAAPIGRIEVEAAFYAAIAAHRNLAGNAPKLLGYDATNRMLAMQDLGSSSDLTDTYCGNTAQQQPSGRKLQEILDWLSALHAISPPSDFPANNEMRALNHAHIFRLPLHAETHTQLGEILGPQTSILAREITSNRELHDQAKELGELYLGTASRVAQNVLLHGDYYPGSWLRTADRNICIIDPEFAFVGPAEFDVGVVMAHLQFIGFEQEQIAAALDGYRSPPDFERRLARKFAGMEVIRRLLGVAQLPLRADDDTKTRWLKIATDLLIAN